MADQASQRLTIAASPQQLFDVVIDFDHYTDWIRDLKAVEVVSRDDEDRAVEIALASLHTFKPLYSAAWTAGMSAKLGLSEHVSDDMTGDLFGLLEQGQVDWTSFFRALARAARGDAEPARGVFADLAEFDRWLARWRALDPDGAAMDRVNPVYIPRNHLVEEALAAASTDDLGPLHRLLDAVTAPFHERSGLERYAEPAPGDFGSYRTFCGT